MINVTAMLVALSCTYQLSNAAEVRVTPGQLGEDSRGVYPGQSNAQLNVTIYRPEKRAHTRHAVPVHDVTRHVHNNVMRRCDARHTRHALHTRTLCHECNEITKEQPEITTVSTRLLIAIQSYHRPRVLFVIAAATAAVFVCKHGHKREMLYLLTYTHTRKFRGES